MSIAWTTVAVLTLLLPGFLFFVTLYLPERFSRDIPKSPLGQLAGTLLVAFSLHGIFYITWPLLLRILPWNLPAIDVYFMLSAIQPPSDRRDLHALAEHFAQYKLNIIAYVLWSSGVGGLGGLLTGRWMGAAGGRLLAKHTWSTDLRFPEDPGELVTYAHVMTTIRQQDLVLMYSGALEDMTLSASGQVSYIVLLYARRGYMLLRQDGPVTSEALAWPTIGKQVARGDQALYRRLYLHGDQISNVVFETVRSPEATSVKRMDTADFAVFHKHAGESRQPSVSRPEAEERPESPVQAPRSVWARVVEPAKRVLRFVRRWQ